MPRTARKNDSIGIGRPVARRSPSGSATSTARARSRSGEGERVDLDATLDFLRLIWALDHGLQVSSKRMVTESGVTGPQRLVVRLVGKYSGISAGELARILHVHKSTISGVIHRLESRRLVTRALDARDARRARLSLTASGRRLSRDMPNTVEAAVKRALASVEGPDVEASRRVLEALARELIGPRR